MRSVRRILVAIKEPDEKNLPALEKAVQLAKAYRAELQLFHALPAPVYLSLDGREYRVATRAQQARRLELRNRLEALATPCRKHGLTVSVHVAWDAPSGEAIVRRARHIRADLIVAATHAGPRRRMWPLRLTDWDLLRLSPDPVLLVKNAPAYRNPVILAAVDPTHAFAKPAKLDEAILSAADSVRAALRGTLHAVHAYVPMPVEAAGPALWNPEATQLLNDRVRAYALARLKALFKKVKVPRSRQHVIGARPIDAVLKVADAIDCDIVVMGAVSRSGLKRVFIGNTAENVLDQLRCDVLVVKPPGFQSRLKQLLRVPRIRPVLR
jgi:universal stress protein E